MGRQIYPSQISLIYAGKYLFKTFMKVKSIVYIPEKSECMRQGWLRGNARQRQKRKTESVKYVIENIFQILNLSSHTDWFSLTSLSLLVCNEDHTLCQHKSPTQRTLRVPSSAMLGSPVLSTANSPLSSCTLCRKWEQRVADLFTPACSPIHARSCVGSRWHTLLCRPAPVPVKSCLELPGTCGVFPISNHTT